MPAEALQEVRMHYAPPDHDVFTWVPPEFELAARHYFQMSWGSATVTRDNIWHCYHVILGNFKAQAFHTTTLPSEVQLQGNMHAELLVQSESGARRGDAWGYDVLDALEWHEEVIPLIGHVEEQSEEVLSDDVNPEAVFTGDEADDEADETYYSD